VKRGAKELVVTADDFGAALEVNEAVERAHREGILSAASLIVTAPAATDAVRRAARMPRLRVGVHLVLIDGPAALPARRLPDLTGDDGRLRADRVGYGGKLLLSRSARSQLAQEIAAQFALFRATGLTLDHVDAHQHFHLHPLIGREVVRQAAANGARFVRVPREPWRVLKRLEVHPPGARALLAPFARLLARRVSDAGLRTPDQVFGLAWSGAMTSDRLVGLIGHLPQGLTEIYTHPATGGAFAGAAAGYRYSEELAALIAPEVIEAARISGARLGGFSDFL